MLDGSYHKLFAIAQGAMRTANSIRKPHDRNSNAHSDAVPYHHCLFLESAQLEVVALDYAIAALEAYVNYLGYIFIDGWAVLQKKHFWGQYEQVRDSFAKLQIVWPEQPLPQYRVLRDKRNQLHHVHSALARNHRGEQATIHSEDAARIVNGVADFMQDTHAKLKERLAGYPSFEAIWLKIAEDNQLKQRKALYDDFIQRGVDL